MSRDNGKNGKGENPPVSWQNPKWIPEDIAKQIREFADNNLVPSINGFCYKINLSSVYLFELAKKHEIITESIKYLMDKKIADTERGMIMGKIHPTVGIWILKQLGQTDRAQITLLNSQDREPLIPRNQINKHIDNLINAEFKVEDQDETNE